MAHLQVEYKCRSQAKRKGLALGKTSQRRTSGRPYPGRNARDAQDSSRPSTMMLLRLSANPPCSACPSKCFRTLDGKIPHGGKSVMAELGCTKPLPGCLERPRSGKTEAHRVANHAQAEQQPKRKPFCELYN